MFRSNKMDRKTRKANLKKLQMPGTTSTRPTRLTKSVSAAISGCFTTPTKTKALNEFSAIREDKETRNPLPDIQLENSCDVANECVENKLEDANAEALIHKTAKRTRLDSFLKKDKQPNSRRLDDFEVPDKTTKKAPEPASKSDRTKAKNGRTRSKRQQSIKSAFMRNEEMFSEITAQHCLADNFSPEDMQLALALSKSEAESTGVLCHAEEMEGVVDIENNADGAQQNIRDKLRCYGFRTAPDEDYKTITSAFYSTTRRMKTKWSHKFTPLTLRDAAQQMKKVHQRVDELLRKQYIIKPLNDVELHQKPYILQSSLLISIKPKEGDEVFSKAESLSTDSLENFYVTTLFKVSQIKAGHLLKDWTKIEGRDLTPPRKSQRKLAAERKFAEKFVLAYKELERLFNNAGVGDENSLSAEDNADVCVLHGGSEPNAINNASVQIATNAATHLEQSKGANLTERKRNQLDEITGCAENETESLKLLERSAATTTSNKEPQKEHRADELYQINNTTNKAESPTKEKSFVIDSSPLKEPPDKKPKLQSPYSPEKLECPEVCAVQGLMQRQRETSPDLFADSDTDVEGVCDVLSPKKKHISDNEDILGVEVFEIYSSDEVKTSSVDKIPEVPLKANVVNGDSVILVDLTQDDLESQTTAKPPTVLKEVVDLFLSSSNESINFENKTDSQECAKAGEVLNSIEVDLVPKTKTSDTSALLNMPNDTQHSLNFDNILHEINSADRSKSCYDFDGDKEKSTSFHFQTGLQRYAFSTNDFNSDETNDNSFLRLQNKYQNANNVPKYSSRRSVSMTQFDLSNIGKKRLSFTQFEYQLYNNVEVAEKTSRKSLNTSLSRRTESAATLPKYDKVITEATQNDVDSEEDDCIILSDDEINYSIWKADKTMHLTDDNEPQIYTQDLTLSSDSDNEAPIYTQDLTLSSHSENEHFPSQNHDKYQSSDTENEIMSGNVPIVDERKRNVSEAQNYKIRADTLKNYEIEDLTDISKSKPFNTEEISLVNRLSENYMDHNKDSNYSNTSPVLTSNLVNDEPTESEFLWSDTNDLYSCISPVKSHDQIEERADSALLDGCSLLLATAEDTPSNTSSKQRKSKSTNILADFSFLNSPSEKSAPMKRFSSASSSQRFNALLKQVQLEQQSLQTSSRSLEDFDEFDKLVYGSPRFKQPRPQNPSLTQPLPSGLDKLLTAKINSPMECNNEEEKSYSTPKKTFKQNMLINGHTYEVRVTTSPKPNFNSQSDEELQKQLYNFGIKPLKRKQALLMLEYIYNQTHPILVNENEDKPQKNIEVSDEVDELDANEELYTQSCVELQSVKTTATEALTESQEPEANNKYNLCDCFGEVLLLNQPLSAELADEQYIFQTNVSKKLSQALLPLHVAWFNLVSSSVALHEAILMYKPIDLQEIYLFLKSLGYRYDPKDLKSFFDGRCIIFRYDMGVVDNPGEARNRHVRKRKKMLTQKNCNKNNKLLL